MATTVKITDDGTKISVVSPYNPTFVSKARALNGKWTGSAWTFDSRDGDRVRDICKAIYGFDGRAADEAVDMVSVRITVEDIREQSYWRFGRELLNRPGRDSAVRLGTAVVIISGKFPSSGGSVKYPEIYSKYSSNPPVVLEVRDIPRSLVDADTGEYEIVEDKPAETTNIALAGAGLDLLKTLRERLGLTDAEIVTAALNVYDLHTRK